MGASMARPRAASDGERNVEEDFEALRSELDALRGDFAT
jgi:hypothetical protein